MFGCVQVESQKKVFPKQQVHGQRQKTDYGAGSEQIIGDDYKQPGDRIRQMGKDSRENLMQHLVNWITDPKVTRDLFCH